jgi:hypothetical protein
VNAVGDGAATATTAATPAAPPIWTNPITDSNPSALNPYITGDVKDSNVSVSGISRGSGITAGSASNRYNASGWNSTSLDANDYFQFTITPTVGYQVSLTSFVYTSQASTAAGMSVAVRSSIDGYTNNIGAATITGTTIDLSGASFQNISSPITFRLYAWGAGAAGNTFSVNDFSFNGSVGLVPTITINGNSSGSATAFTSTYGTPGTAQTFTIAGSNLTGDITATAPTGFEVSNDGTTYGSTATFTQTGGTASGSLRVRLAGTANVSGSYNSQPITLASTGATTRNITTASTGNSVSKATPTISVAPTASAITYGQTLASSNLTGGTASVEGTFAFTTPSTAPNAGTASQNVTFTPTDGANYNTASTSASVTVDKASQTITSLAATDDSKTYGGIYMDFDLTATKGASTSALSYSSSNTGVATIHPTTGSVHIVGAGTTTLTVNQAADANYNAAPAVTQILTVGKAAITLAADAKSKTYGASDPFLTYTITSGALVVGDSLTGGLSRAAGEDVGTYAISSTLANPNYNISFTGANFTITAANIASSAITLTPAGDGSYTASATGGASFTYSYVGRNQTSYGPSATAPTGAGFYSVTATANGNYSGSKSADFSITGPMAIADSLTKPADNEPYMIPVSELLTNDFRITSTSGATVTTGLSVTAVTGGAGNTASYNVGDRFIQFTPSSGASDTFTYSVTDGVSTATATVTVTTETQAPTFNLQIVKVGTAIFAGGNTTVRHDFIAVPNQTYLVEYATDLNGTWTSAGNQSTGTTGSFSVTFTTSGDVAADWTARMFFRARLVR